MAGRAGDLEIGDHFLDENGQLVVVEALNDPGKFESVYNLCVEDFHTYFVGASEWGFSVWAHNTDPTGSCEIPGSGGDKKPEEGGASGGDQNPLAGKDLKTLADMKNRGEVTAQQIQEEMMRRRAAAAPVPQQPAPLPGPAPAATPAPAPARAPTPTQPKLPVFPMKYAPA